MNHEYYFIAVNFNGFIYSKKYIESIQKLKKDTNDIIKIIIVDNNSFKEEINSLVEFCKNYENILIKFNPSNIGYFKGLNEGIKNISSTRNTKVIIGNNDLTFNEDFIVSLKTLKYDNTVMVLAPDVITSDGKHQNPLIIKKYSYINKIKANIYNSNYYIGTAFQILNRILLKIFKKKKREEIKIHRMNIRAGIGACYVLTPNFFRIFNKLNDPVFMWCEEVIFANQIESVNGKILYDDSLIVHHLESATVKNILNKEKYYIRKKSYQISKPYL